MAKQMKIDFYYQRQ